MSVYILFTKSLPYKIAVYFSAGVFLCIFYEIRLYKEPIVCYNINVYNTAVSVSR